MREALADPVFGDSAPPLADLRLAASNAPALARAFLELHRAYRQSHERLASLDEALGREDAALRPAPGKRCAISFTIATITSTRWTARPNALQAGRFGRHDRAVAARRWSDQGISRWPTANRCAAYDPLAGVLTLSARAAPETQRFQMLHQVALLTQAR
jgi:XRE family transcriptional regulator, fatty acid utilization regulator